ncbi:UDP-N-acetylmuramoyl-tripeptide--D-alanyl-D-alanine ligase [Leptospira gomenensis]|uniref:UDP-N-acetylmuramoyl-tripeptide--D-alanyl-D-alanine ligase n=1 Tax=Leptospira gomenensis TaxID=2484974 RepID=A0A5F1Z2N1_9LEPT|nr:UDP-N-acetylmuramoyl-tripeptide--D-alanyl-D-alanine ligase [Leptospira gomenensis]TGK28935.1 UDP-N-acetylmuramoyl-tripeptide--D-alanyl-D-alanine ligase [Leptospira gomenensis]TGK40694.1 UDP-N-acetylmuramoyl-tripeptide--D-alanyl-D-alanine ligase [Leptospira gomenensis]TGK42515.1 UDP-N-acetylmuramoyl-tripeptide--D-alanyl-D-alanine ligase [Leptospira gomenensis]TGK68462.1 UDP-N-acetylmuramoyl-tripeptide--D-alanyl-D-alanine ligase [Leptospira gomenensis]
MKAAFHYDPATLRRVLNVDEGIESFFQKEPPIHSITTSSSEAEQNSLFVPLRGNRDGHEFIPDALSKGASYFLCEKNHSILSSLSKDETRKAMIVDDTLRALGELAAFHRSRFRPVVIAVTGSSGKTTTKELFASCLKNLGEDALVVTEKNYNNEIGLPFTVFRIDDKTRIAVCEMGMNHKGEIARLSKIAKPDFAVITTIGTAHIEFLGSRKNIAKAKAEVVEGMPRGGFLFYPSSGEYSKILNKKTGKYGVTFEIADTKRFFKVSEKKSSGFVLEYDGKPVVWNLPGDRLLENVAVTTACLEKIGVPKDWIAAGISEFRSANKRLDFQRGKYSVINDTYNANYESMISSLEVASQLSEGKDFYAVLGDMRELGKHSRSFHKKLGKVCAGFENLKGLFTFGADSTLIQREFSKRSNDSKLSFHFPDTEDGLGNLLRTFTEKVPEGSVVLAKASRGIRLERFVEGLPADTV